MLDHHDSRTWSDDDGGGLVVDGHGPVVLGQPHHQLRVAMPAVLLLLLLLVVQRVVVAPVRVVVVRSHLLLLLQLGLLLLLLLLEMRRHGREGHDAALFTRIVAAVQDKDITPPLDRYELPCLFTCGYAGIVVVSCSSSRQTLRTGYVRPLSK